jgi:hypothetical protein
MVCLAANLKNKGLLSTETMDAFNTLKSVHPATVDDRKGILSDKTINWEINWRLLVVAYHIGPCHEECQMKECAQPPKRDARNAC